MNKEEEEFLLLHEKYKENREREWFFKIVDVLMGERWNSYKKVDNTIKDIFSDGMKGEDYMLSIVLKLSLLISMIEERGSSSFKKLSKEKKW